MPKTPGVQGSLEGRTTGGERVKCQGAHHVAICGDSEQTLGRQDQDNVASVSTSMYVDQSRRSVLLQTTTTEVVHPDNNSHPLSVCLVFDSCSQRSYTTKDLKDKLKLPVIGRESLLIKTFGESDARLPCVMQLCTYKPMWCQSYAGP